MNYKVLNNLIYIFCILIIHHSKGGDLLHQIVSPVICHFLLSISHAKTCLATFTYHPWIHFFWIHIPHLRNSIVRSPTYTKGPISNWLADFFSTNTRCIILVQIANLLFLLIQVPDDPCENMFQCSRTILDFPELFQNYANHDFQNFFPWTVTEPASRDLMEQFKDSANPIFGLIKTAIRPKVSFLFMIYVTCVYIYVINYEQSPAGFKT